MTTLEIVLLTLCVTAAITIWAVLKNAVPASSVSDLASEVEKLRSDLAHANQTAGAYRANMDVLEQQLGRAERHAGEMDTLNRKLQFESKSSQVRVGNLSEQIIGLIDGFDYDTKQMRFIGSPIDYVVFAEDEITFLEVKSGAAQLTPKQRHLKKLVESGKVSWKTVRLTEKGLKK
jgi:predicted Holliday junction resolvase-like endonuclease